MKLKVKCAQVHAPVQIAEIKLINDTTIDPRTKHKGAELEYDEQGLWITTPSKCRYLIPAASVRVVTIAEDAPKKESK